jgi:hypothetical protein
MSTFPADALLRTSGDGWFRYRDGTTGNITPPDPGLLPMLLGANSGPPGGHDYDAYDTIFSNISGSKPGGTNSGLSVRRSYQELGAAWPCTFSQSLAAGDPGRPCASLWSIDNHSTWSTLASGNGGTERTNWINFFNSIPDGHIMWIAPLGHENDNGSSPNYKYPVAPSTQLAAQANVRGALAASNKANSPYIKLGVILTVNGYNASPGAGTWINTTPGVLDWCGCDGYYYYEPDATAPTNGTTSDRADTLSGKYKLANMTPVHRYGTHVTFADAHGLDKLNPEWNAHPDPANGANPGGYRPALIHDHIAYLDQHGYKASLIFNANSGTGTHTPWWTDAFTNWSNKNDFTTFPDVGSPAAYRDELSTHVRYALNMLG